MWSQDRTGTDRLASFNGLTSRPKRGRRAESRARRHHRLGYRPDLSELETRQLLTVSAIVGPVMPPETLNVQLNAGSVADLSQLMPLINAEGGTVQSTMISGLYEVQGSATNMAALAQQLAGDAAVVYAQPQQTLQIASAPNDPEYTDGQQWQLNSAWGINAPTAWNTTTGSDAVVVADVDTGVNYNWSDINDNIWINQAEIPDSVKPNLTDVLNDGVITFGDLNAEVNGVYVNQGPGKIEDSTNAGYIDGSDVLASTSVGGWASGSTQDGNTSYPDDLIGWNFVNNTNNPSDGNGHGSFTAAEIAEVANNGYQGAGVDWNVQLMPLVAFNSSGSGTDTWCAEAIDYAVNMGAKVINCSWAFGGPDSTIQTALQYADQHGVIVVAAAGNYTMDNDNTFLTPASYSAVDPNVIAVAATNKNGTIANYSDWGVGTVQLAAPGTNVYVEGQTDSGTSMAAPLVAGTVALVESAHPTWSMQQVVDAVVQHTTPDSNLSGLVGSGGIVNAGSAVANTSGPHVTTASLSGAVTGGSLSSIELTFNEDINPTTFTPSQVTLTGPNGTISGISVALTSTTNDTQFTISFPTQTSAGTYTLKVGPDIQDWYGNEMNQNGNLTNGESSDAYADTMYLAKTGSPDVLSVTGFPTVTTAGTAQTITVTALTPSGSVDTSFTGTVAFSSSDPDASLPSNFTFTSSDKGTYTFTSDVTLCTQGAQSITVADTANSAIVGAEEDIWVNGATASSLVVSGLPSTETAGSSFNFTVTAEDKYGNIATGYTGTIGFSSTDAQAVLPSSYSFLAGNEGTFTFSATLKTAGSQTITASDSTNDLSATSAGVTVDPGAAVSLVVSGYPNPDTDGTSDNFTVTAYDAYGNVATGYTGTVDFSSSDPKASLPSPYTFNTSNAGKYTFAATLNTWGDQSLTATDSSKSTITGSESNILVCTLGPQYLQVSGFPTTDTAGTSYAVTVGVYNGFGNIVTGYTGTVHFTSSDGQAVLPANYTFTSSDAGQYTFNVTLKTAGTQYIAVTDTTTSTLTGRESGIVVQPAAAQSLKITGLPATLVPATPNNFTVTAFDAYGNVASGYAGTIQFTSSDSQATLPSNYTFTAANAGAASFSVTFATPGTQSLSATDTATATITGSTSVTVTSTSVLFLDSFTESTPSTAWSFVSGTWQINSGVLSQTSTASGDPKKAMITNQTYPSNVMITAEVQVNSWNAGDMARAGVGLDTNTSTGDGYNLIFHDTNQVQFLEDNVGWGNSYSFNWQVGAWYWFQLEENNGSLYGKVWAAGTAEPTSWMYEQPNWSGGTGGAPALNGSSASSTKGSATVSFANVSVTTTSVQPDTAYAGTALSANAGSAVTFGQATASGTAPLTYSWAFGDGTTANGTLDATHTYETAGTYTATLTVTDALGIPAVSTVSVTVASTGSTSGPTVNAGPAFSVNAGSAATFSQATESGGTAPFSYTWIFGDGSQSSGSLNPTHTFQNPGTYTATVTVTDAKDLTSSSSAVVTVNDVAPTVTLNDPSSGSTGTSISFAANATDISPADTAAGFTYAWNFGDGGTATGADPSHTFASAGTYTVTVTATDEYGLSGTASGTITISVPSTSPILFQDTFNESKISSAWSFVGGTWQLNNGALSQTSTAAADPKKAMITNETYPSNVMITAEVEVNTWTAGSMARAGVGLYTNTTSGEGYNLVFHGTNQVQFLDDGVKWGNSYSFNWQVGTWYWFQLEESNGTLYGKIWAAGTAEPTSWMYEQTGWSDRTSGAPALNGSSASSSGGSATVSFADVSVTNTSVQDDTAYAGTPLSANAGSAVTFSQATASGTAPLAYAWNFGDGATASGTLNAAHTYQSAGTYTATLTVTDALGIPTVSTVTVTATGSTSPTVSAGPAFSVNAGSSATFSQATESGGTAPFSYSWSFGDGSQSSGSLNPTHTYQNPGAYTATVMVTDANDLTSSSSAVVTVNDVAPTVTLNDPSAGTAGVSLNLAATATDVSPADIAAGFTYAWSFGDGGTGTGADPTHTFASAGTYTLTVTATDEYGLSGTASGTITISTSPILFQSNFSANTSSSAWTYVGGTWEVSNGELSQTSTASADPKKAMIINQTYPSNVMITAEVQVNSWTAGDMARAGVGLYTNTTTGDGYNLVFHDTNQVQFLDDHVIWGNSYSFNWQVGTWYWFQLEESNGTLYGKVWAAGTAEPTSWMYQQAGWTDRTGGAPRLTAVRRAAREAAPPCRSRRFQSRQPASNPIPPTPDLRSPPMPGRQSHSARRQRPEPRLCPTPGTSATAIPPAAHSTPLILMLTRARTRPS